MRRLLISAIITLIFSYSAFGFKDQVCTIHSESMKKDILVSVITPDSYDQNKDFPTVYLLHGYSDNHRAWVERTVVKELADQYGIIVVAPDGGYDSWYFDSKLVPDYQYETFVSSELIKYIDENFKTIKDRSARAITGLSMGGHGALHTAIKHQDVFGIVGSTSGGVDIRPFTEKWNIAARLGSYSENPEAWENSTVINMTHLLKPDSLKLIIDCGSEDFFYEVNCNLHKKLLAEGIPHDFYSRPGKHNWPYWRNSIKFQMLFFHNCFTAPAQN
jgi:S-formylglutathione hydrolase FrmB